MFIPKKIFFTKGVGRHKDYLSSFELSLRNAGIEKCNLVTVSSIYPPHCKRISREEGLKETHRFTFEDGPGDVNDCLDGRTSATVDQQT